MKKVAVKNLNKEVRFPIIRAVPDTKKRNIFSRILKFFTFRRKWEIMEEYFLWCPKLNTYIYLPVGFIFDGASVPKILNSFYNPNGILLLGAGPHDLGYRYQGLLLVDMDKMELKFELFSKSELDSIFNSLCILESDLPAASSVATGTLGLFGFLGWWENRKKDCILVNDFPDLFQVNENI